MNYINVYEYLEATVMRVPDRTAFAAEAESFTFREVYEQAESAAAKLHHENIYKEPVVVFMNKHPKNIIAFLAVIASGNFYIPIDDEMPAARIELILENVQARAIICDNETIQTAKERKLPGRYYLYDQLIQTKADKERLQEVRRNIIDTDPVYVVFTSGSTGIPKGVAASHRSLIDYIEQLSKELGFTQESVFANQAPLYFDAAWKEIGATLKLGAATYLVPRNLFLFPAKLVEFLNEHKVNTICWVVSALTMISGFKTFDVVKPEYLHTVVFVGEVFPMKQFLIWKTALPNAAFTNLYGPTEGTGVCCYYHVNREFDENEVLPIGYPFQNTEVILLDEENKKASEGEICIRGSSLTLGYYRDFGKTRECFVQNPLNQEYPELIYRTGDIGRYNAYGELVFVSRKDHQIKHMGHRVELGEIEANVLAEDTIKTACCLYDSQKGKILLYYVGDIGESELAVWLKDRLSRYMMPNRIRKIKVMPLTPNGKIDRKHLYEIK